MAVTYGFYNSVGGDRKYNAEQMGQIFDGIINDGVFNSVGRAFAVTPSSGMVISVGAGRAWFNHTWTYNDAPITLTVGTAPVGSLKRIDAVVIEVDENDRENSIKIIAGTENVTPLRPSLVDSDGVHQYALAYITIDAGVTTITREMIISVVGTDTPFVTGPLETVSVTELYNYWRTEFETWFDHLQDELDSNQAANLQHQIDDITDVMLEDDDVGDLWRWERYTVLPASYFLEEYNGTSRPTSYGKADYRTIAVPNNYGSSNYIQYQYSDSVSVADDGTVTLVNPSTISIYQTSASAAVGHTTLLGKYFKYYSKASNVKGITDSDIHYLDSDAVFGITSGDGIYVDKTKIYTLRGISLKDATKANVETVKFLTSDSPTTYPEDGRSGNYWYTRIGYAVQPMSRIEYGSYVGTGTCGYANPNTLNFSFSPKFVCVSLGTRDVGSAFFIRPMPTACSLGYNGSELICTWRDLSLSWWYYTTEDPSSGYAWNQLNQSGKTYYYVAIG